MAIDHPARILVNEDGSVFIAVESGSSPASPWGFIGLGVDGSTARSFLVDSSGRQVVAQKASGSAVTNVSYSTTNVTLLASNSARLGATVYNDADVDMYLKLGSTASATSFTAIVPPGFYYEVPYGYTGVMDALWAAGGSGAARVTEIT